MPWKKPYNPAQNQRLDPELYTQSNRIYFITIRAHKNSAPFTRNDLNAMVIDTLREEQDRQNFLIFVYCLMPDHIHFLLSPQRDGLSVLKFTEQYKGKTTNRSWKLGWSGKLWQQRYYDHIIRSSESLIEISKYILNNPVRKEIVEVAEDWQWGGHMSQFPDWLLG